jgi:hypothetical protein
MMCIGLAEKSKTISGWISLDEQGRLDPTKILYRGTGLYLFPACSGHIVVGLITGPSRNWNPHVCWLFVMRRSYQRGQAGGELGPGRGPSWKFMFQAGGSD